jgi:hypothetical protein
MFGVIAGSTVLAVLALGLPKPPNIAKDRVKANNEDRSQITYRQR